MPETLTTKEPVDNEYSAIKVEDIEGPENFDLVDHDTNGLLVKWTADWLESLTAKKGTATIPNKLLGPINITRHEIPSLAGQTESKQGIRYELDYKRFGEQPENCTITMLGDTTEVTMHSEDAGKHYRSKNVSWSSAEVSDEYRMGSQFEYIYDRIDRAMKQEESRVKPRTIGGKMIRLWIGKDLYDLYASLKK
jgi:hypothetical protein